MLGTFFIITKGNIHSISISKLALFWGIASAFAAALLSVLWLHEQLGIAQWLGTACIIITIIILSRVKSKKA